MAKKKTETVQPVDRVLARTPGSENLMCDLTLEEQRQRGVALAEQRLVVAKLEAEKKAAADDFKHRLDGANAKADELAKITREKREERMVDTVTVHDPYRACHEVYRNDTGELVRVEPMDKDEVRKLLQVELPLTSRRLDDETLLGGSNDDGAR